MSHSTPPSQCSIPCVVTSVGKVVYIVGGGSNQLSLVHEAKRLGHRVVVSDINENPPCRSEADYFERVDTVDRAGSLVVARKYKVDGVITDQTDAAVPTVALIAEELGLPGIGFETALRFTNKELMRRTMAGDQLVKIPESQYFDNTHGAVEFVDKSGRPPRYWIVKPVNSQGSKGVNRLTGLDDISKFQDAITESRDKGILVEEFIEGDEYSVEAFVKDGIVHNLAVTKKFHYPQNECIDFRNTYLGDIPRTTENALFAANQATILRLGLRDGSTHGEFKVSGNEIYLMEIAARGGGGNISGKIIQFLTDFNPSTALIHTCLDEAFDVIFSDYQDRFAVMRFFDFEPGTLKSITYDYEFSKTLLHFELNVIAGSIIRPIHNSRDRPGYFIIADFDRSVVLEHERVFLSSFDLAYT